MSWQTINKLLTRAMIDTHFADKLLANPIQTAREAGFDLTVEEQQVLCEATVNDISELSQFLLSRLRHHET